MTAPLTKVAILITGTALLFTMHTNTADLVHRDWFFYLLLCTTHRLADSVHRDSIFAH